MSEDKRNINSSESETPEDEFELLMARFLWDDLDEAGSMRLESLAREFPDFARRRREYTETRGFFQRAPGGDLRGLNIIASASPISDAPGMELGDDEILKDLPPELADLKRPETYIPTQPGPKLVSLESRRSPSRGKFLGGGLAAAAAVLLGLGIFFIYGGSAASGEIITLSLGECRSGDKVLKAGDVPAAGEIASGRDSVCDVQFRGEASVAVRLEPDTRVSYIKTESSGAKGGRELFLKLNSGRILVQAEKISQSRGLTVQTPGHLVRVLGTRLTIDGNRPGRLRVRLAEGKAEVVAANYLYLPAFQNGLKPKVRAELEKKLPELFRGERRELTPGTYVRVTRAAKYSEVNKSLFASLNDALKPAADSGTVDAESLSRARKLLNESSAKKALLEKPAVDTGRDSRYHALKLKRRFETFRLLRNEELTTDALKVRKVDAKRILKRVRRASDEPTYVYRVHLKSGKVHMGLLEQVGGERYRLFTGERGIMIPKGQVEKIELVVDE